MTPNAILETRVTNLEELMAQLLGTVDRVARQVGQLSVEMRDFKDEMRVFKNEMGDFKDEMRVFKNEMGDFKDEMRVFKNEMGDFKDEMRVFKNEMGDFKDEMRVFKNEMGDFKDEMRVFKNEMGDFKDEMRDFKTEINQKWGELANKMGTLVEDLVAPSVGRILRTVVGCPEDKIDTLAVRVRKRRTTDNRSHEFDALAICGAYLLINETKSRLRPADLTEFAEFLPEVHSFFPEYGQQKVIGAIASLYVDQSLVRYGERLGLIVLGFGEGVMNVMNAPDFKPKEF